MKVYRIVGMTSRTVPGGKESFTGFWSRNLDCVLNIRDAEEQYHNCYRNCGSPPSVKIYETEMDNVEIADGKDFKDFDNKDFDDGEIFVIGIKEEKRISINDPNSYKRKEFFKHF